MSESKVMLGNIERKPIQESDEFNGRTYEQGLLDGYKRKVEHSNMDECAIEFNRGYQQGIADYKASDEYAKAINEAFNQGVDVGKRDLMSEAIEKDIRANERARLLGILSPLGAMDSFEVDGKELKWGIRYAVETIRGGTLENVFRKDFKIGDVVIDTDGIKAVVIDYNTSEDIMVMNENGCCELVLIDNLTYVSHWCDVELLVKQLQNFEVGSK